MLFQEVPDVDRPISIFSKKLDQHQANYSTIEKECFALLSALFIHSLLDIGYYLDILGIIWTLNTGG